MDMLERQELKKKQLVDSAVDLFYERGFQETRVSDIVRRAGVAQGTFYLYFKSKDDIFLHICQLFTSIFKSMLENTTHFFSGSSSREVRENLIRFTRELIVLFVENEKMARILFGESSGYGGRFKNVYEGIYADFIQHISMRLKESRDSDHINFEDAETEAAFLVGMFDRTLFYFIGIKKKVNIKDLSRRMADFILGGLSKKNLDPV